MTCNIINWPHQLTQHFPTLFTSETGYGMWAHLTNRVWNEFLLLVVFIRRLLWCWAERRPSPRRTKRHEKQEPRLPGFLKATPSFVWLYITSVCVCVLLTLCSRVVWLLVVSRRPLQHTKVYCTGADTHTHTHTSMSRRWGRTDEIFFFLSKERFF